MEPSGRLHSGAQKVTRMGDFECRGPTCRGTHAVCSRHRPGHGHRRDARRYRHRARSTRADGVLPDGCFRGGCARGVGQQMPRRIFVAPSISRNSTTLHDFLFAVCDARNVRARGGHSRTRTRTRRACRGKRTSSARLPGAPQCRRANVSRPKDV